MTVTFDTTGTAITDIIRVVNSVTTVVTPAAAFDYFSDTAVVNDYIAFGWEYGKFHELVINVGTAVAAAAFTVIWEYSDGDASTWRDLTTYITGAVDFTTTGSQTLSFTPPANWKIYRRPAGLGNDNSCASYVRARVTAVTSITEGGANATTAPTCSDYTISVDNTGNRLSTIQAADTAGGWGVVTTTGNTTFINANLRLGTAGTAGELFIRANETLELGGTDNYFTFINSRASNLFQLGYLSAGVITESGVFRYFNNTVLSLATVTYNKWAGTFNMYDSLMWKRSGGFSDMEVDSICNLYNSILVSTSHIFFGFSSAAQVFSNVTFDVGSTSNNVYLYGSNATYSGLVFTNCSGIVVGSAGAVTVSNVTFATGKTILVTNGGTNASFVDCTFSNFVTQTTLGSDNNYAREKYTLSIACIKPDKTAITGFSARVKDASGAVLFAGGAWSTNLVVECYKRYRTGGATTDTDYNPITIDVYASGYKPYRTTMTMTNLNKALTVTLQPAREMITIGV